MARCFLREAASNSGSQVWVFQGHYRIGEAKKPGPQKRTTDSKSVYRVNIGNVTHIKNNAHLIAKREFEVIFVVEHSCTQVQAHEICSLCKQV